MKSSSLIVEYDSGDTSSSCSNDSANNDSILSLPARGPPSRRKPPTGRVQWDNVTIYEHIMELGDNPSVSCGVPVTIGWKADSINTVSVDQFEQVKQEQLPSRSKSQMCLPRSYREDLCCSAGASRSEVLRETLMVKRAQEQRYKSAKEGQWKRKLASSFKITTRRPYGKKTTTPQQQMVTV